MSSVVVHCHFYQPPREDPWRDVVAPEPTAAPFHNWNERITHECYEPFASARLLDPEGHVAGSVNLYDWVSFDVGPTLLRWLEAHAPAVYEVMLAADRASARRLRGHGNAIAMPFNHIILPLASRRDKVTEIRWGLADFRRRFGRDAEGFWLPETAVDEETLVVLAEEGIRFTILGPHQLENPGASGEPLGFAAGGGREIAIFAYDGPLSHDAAFGPLLENGTELARRLAPPPPGRGTPKKAARVVGLALDGETFGHHRKFAEMALATAVSTLRTARNGYFENYGSVLARVPPRERARLVEPSSWSCAHGVERWRSDCACGMLPGASHAWRRPLRAALNWLAREIDARFESEAATLFDAPWSVRDALGGVAGSPADRREAFATSSVRVQANAVRALQLLDAQRARLAMFGSCAWFFDDIAGHEAMLMLCHAARAIELVGDEQLEVELLERLALAPGNDPATADGAAAYRAGVVPRRDRAAS
jgi:alpha-amylase/alpha-mannosidase (GH57 family)